MESISSRRLLALSAFFMLIFCTVTLPAIGDELRSSQEAEHWLNASRQAHKLGSGELRSVEILTQYSERTPSGEQRQLKDFTRLVLPHTLEQERWINEVRIRRGLVDGEAYIESGSDRTVLGPEMVTQLTGYICQRRLSLLSICPNLRVEMDAPDAGPLVWIRVLKSDSLFGRLGIDRKTKLLHSVEIKQGYVPDPENPQPVDITIKYSQPRALGSWLFGHHVEAWYQGELAYSYKVTGGNITLSETHSLHSPSQGDGNARAPAQNKR